ncbi:MAG: metallopeptidase family protein [Pseudomonadota bacterium]
MNFQGLVLRALNSLPRVFQDKMENVEILVEDFPDDETLESLGIQSKWELFGLYSGVPLPHHGFFGAPVLPERIYLYQRPILGAARDENEVFALIRDVLIHEIGHHFGFDEDELEEMEGDREF